MVQELDRVEDADRSGCGGAGSPESSATELLLEDSVLLAEIIDHGFLVPIDPAGHRRNENLPGLEQRAHSAIVGDYRANRQLTIGRGRGLEWPRFTLDRVCGHYELGPFVNKVLDSAKQLVRWSRT